MSIIDWMSASMIIDIAFVVFTLFYIFKFRKQRKSILELSNSVESIEKEILEINEKIEMHKKGIVETYSNMEIMSKDASKSEEELESSIERLENKIDLVIRNPQSARRKLKNIEE
jgi:hypothetical protein